MRLAGKGGRLAAGVGCGGKPCAAYFNAGRHRKVQERYQASLSRGDKRLIKWPGAVTTEEVADRLVEITTMTPEHVTQEKPGSP